MTRRWRIVYTWRGERHSVLRTFTTKKAALAALRLMRFGGWNAWVEVEYSTEDGRG